MPISGTIAQTPDLAASLARKAAAIQHAKLVKQSQRLVSQTFFGSMLKEMRNSPFKSKLFDGGRGGEMFASMLDQHLADKMARGAGKPLVNSIVRHIEKSLHTNVESSPATNGKTPRLFKQSSYSSPPAGEGGSYVAADFRA